MTDIIIPIAKTMNEVSKKDDDLCIEFILFNIEGYNFFNIYKNTQESCKIGCMNSLWWNTTNI